MRYLTVRQLPFKLADAGLGEVGVIFKRQARKALEIIKLLKVIIGYAGALKAEYLETAQLCKSLRAVKLVAAEDKLFKLL